MPLKNLRLVCITIIADEPYLPYEGTKFIRKNCFSLVATAVFNN